MSGALQYLEVRVLQNHLSCFFPMSRGQVDEGRALGDIRHVLEGLADRAGQVPALHSVSYPRLPSKASCPFCASQTPRCEAYAKHAQHAEAFKLRKHAQHGQHAEAFETEEACTACSYMWSWWHLHCQLLLPQHCE